MLNADWSPHDKTMVKMMMMMMKTETQSIASTKAIADASGWNLPQPDLPHGVVVGGAAVVQEVKKSFSNQKVASSIPCRSVLEQDTEPLIAPDVQCAISVNVKCVYILVSRFG